MPSFRDIALPQDKQISFGIKFLYYFNNFNEIEILENTSFTHLS